YRLPTEAEWDWAARVDDDPASLLRFPWGMEMPPPENHGNYADLSAAELLGRILPNYNDSYLASAPVGSFSPNAQGFHDMGGNVADRFRWHRQPERPPGRSRPPGPGERHLSRHQGLELGTRHHHPAPSVLSRLRRRAA